MADLDAAPYAKLVRDAGDQAFVEAIVLRASEAGPVTSRINRIRGAVALEDSLPLAPTREFAAPILGRVGDVTAEIVEESDGRLQAGDVAGVSGLQARYDEQLAGTPGLVVSAGDEEVFSTDPEPGTALVTTLDPRLQTRAERVLAVPEGAEAPATALVAVRPSDGAILAAASGAGGDGLNVATYGQYAPGSTFKVVSALALLRAGLTPESRVSCPTTLSVDGKSFKNYDDYPAGALGRDHAAPGGGELVQHRVRGVRRRARPRATWRGRRRRWGSGSTRTSASRRTSGRCRRRAARPRRRPT